MPNGVSSWPMKGKARKTGTCSLAAADFRRRLCNSPRLRIDASGLMDISEHILSAICRTRLRSAPCPIFVGSCAQLAFAWASCESDRALGVTQCCDATGRNGRAGWCASGKSRTSRFARMARRAYRTPGAGYWRTSIGEEVDFVIEAGGKLLPIEVKSAARPRLGDTTHLRTFRAEYGKKARAGLLLRTGNTIEWLAPDVLAAPWWRVL